MGDKSLGDIWAEFCGFLGRWGGSGRGILGVWIIIPQIKKGYEMTIRDAALYAIYVRIEAAERRKFQLLLLECPPANELADCFCDLLHLYNLRDNLFILLHERVTPTRRG